MENSEPTQDNQQSSNGKNSAPLIMFVVTFILVAIALWQFSGGKVEKRPIEVKELFKDDPKEQVVAEEVLPEEADIIEIEPVSIEIEQVELTVDENIEAAINPLPTLDESDSWMQAKLPELTWRNELLSLLINDDMIRRFVVFTDNFSQGLLAYEHSPFTQPKVKFSVDEQSVESGENNVWQWDGATSKRFDLYVDLLRSVDSATLVNLYFDAKPLIDEAYSELGYEEDFTYVLQDAITRVLDMELPKSSMALTRTSVMYKFEDAGLESLADSDKLLLRIGKENLLIIKSILLEVNEKLTKKAESKS
jgi:hypothetical protein